MRTTKLIMLALMSIGLVFAGCDDVDVSDTRFACDVDGDCPSGFLCCGDGFCRDSCQMGDADTDVDTDTDTDSDTDTDTSFECDGTTCIDPQTGLEWQRESTDRMTIEEATAYCDGLGMRVPDMDDLRSLVRGCRFMEPGGSCGITAECSNYTECYGGICGCDTLDGPSYDGNYWPDEFDGTLQLICGSTVIPDREGSVWGIYYHQASFYFCHSDAIQTRCVR